MPAIKQQHSIPAHSGRPVFAEYRKPRGPEIHQKNRRDVCYN